MWILSQSVEANPESSSLKRSSPLHLRHFLLGTSSEGRAPLNPDWQAKTDYCPNATWALTAPSYLHSERQLVKSCPLLLRKSAILLAFHCPLAYGARQRSFIQQTSHPLTCTAPRHCSYYCSPVAMPFREMMKRAFGGRPSDEGSDVALTQTSSSSKRSRKEKKNNRRNSPSNVYRPGEIMPKPKYQSAYNKVHQDMLLAYNFGDAWKKRKSVQSQYISPMGSRWPSARSSMAISRQQSYSAATTERAVDDESTTITMNGDHSYLYVGNGECFQPSISPFAPELGGGGKREKKKWHKMQS